MGRPTYARKPALKSDLNGNLSRSMKKEVRDVKTEVIVKNHSLVEMEILSYASEGVRLVRFEASGYECLDCGKKLNHWNIAVNRNNLRYHIEVRYFILK